jgi:hypothetical protein
VPFKKTATKPWLGAINNYFSSFKLWNWIDWRWFKIPSVFPFFKGEDALLTLARVRQCIAVQSCHIAYFILGFPCSFKKRPWFRIPNSVWNPRWLHNFKGEDVLSCGVGMRRLAMSETTSVKAQLADRFLCACASGRPATAGMSECYRTESFGFGLVVKFNCVNKGDKEIESVRHLIPWRCTDVWAINCKAFLMRWTGSSLVVGGKTTLLLKRLSILIRQWFSLESVCLPSSQ